MKLQCNLYTYLIYFNNLSESTLYNNIQNYFFLIVTKIYLVSHKFTTKFNVFFYSTSYHTKNYEANPMKKPPRNPPVNKELFLAYVRTWNHIKYIKNKSFFICKMSTCSIHPGAWFEHWFSTNSAASSVFSFTLSQFIDTYPLCWAICSNIMLPPTANAILLPIFIVTKPVSLEVLLNDLICLC